MPLILELSTLDKTEQILKLSKIEMSQKLNKNGMGECNIEGRTSSEWKLIDAIDVIVHIFHPEKRKFYDLEKMWCDPTNKKEMTL